MEITRNQFAAYVAVQQSGATNMFDVRQVSALSGGILTSAQVIEIIRNYGELSDKYGINAQIS